MAKTLEKGNVGSIVKTITEQNLTTVQHRMMVTKVLAPNKKKNIKKKSKRKNKLLTPSSS